MSVQLIALLANIGLALLKFVVGTLAGSKALIADAFNSAGDIVATFVAWLAFRYAQQPPDDDHHYGHHNAEALAGLLIGGMLFATGAFISIDGVLALVEDRTPAPPGSAALWAAAATAIIKETLYRMSMRVGKATHSPTLLASARDHRADVVSSGVAFAGILLARDGHAEWDAIAGVGIGLYILTLAWEPVRNNIDILMHAAPKDLDAEVARVAQSVEGIRAIEQVRVQPLGGHYRVDMVVHVAGDLTVHAGHALATAVEQTVISSVERVTEVHVHVEPAT